MRVAIIGAGLAGLAAADACARSGHEPVVLEARDRVGGRTWSTTLEGGKVVERGAEFIYATDYAVRGLAARFHLPIVSHGVRFSRRTVEGRHDTAAELESSLRRLERASAEAVRSGRPHASLAEVAEHALGSDFRSAAVYLRITSSLAGNPEDASARSLFHEGGARIIGDEGRFLDGNQRLAEALAAGLSGRISLGSAVTAIEQSGRGCLIHLVDGGTVEADACIVAVPLPLLRELDLQYEIPAPATEALDRLRMGVAAKLSLPIASDAQGSVALPDSAQQEPGQTWWSWQSLSADGETRVPLVTSFAGGAALERVLGTDSGAHAWQESLLDRLGPGQRAAGEPWLTDWPSDEWARGAYSFRSTGWEPGDPSELQRPVGRVVLAGEHTGLHPTMNGAVESGLRAAAAVAPMETR